MKYTHMIAFILLAIGGLAWGIEGLFGYSVVSEILGDQLAQIIYVLVGIAALYEIFSHRGRCRECVGMMA